MTSERDDNLTRREAARVVSAASEQIGLALKDSQPAIEGLGVSLAKLAALLREDLSGEAAQQALAELRKDMATAVTNLQFYDRLTQHLTHVRDYLVDSAAQLDAGRTIPEANWSRLHRRLSERLLSETHRMYLGKNFPADYLAEGATPGEKRSASAPGDIDLF